MRANKPLLLVIALGALLRAAHLWFAHDLPYFHSPEGDAFFYDEGARRIAEGDVLLGHGVMRMSPGYHYFLGAVYAAFGASPWPIRILQSALGLFTTALVYGSARTLFGARLSLLPALLAACYGPLIFHESVLLDAALSVFLHALLLYLCLRAAPSARSALGIGLVLGLCAVVRPNALPLALPVGLHLLRPLERLRREPRRLLELAPLALGLALALTPIFARNLVASGEPVLLTAHGGFNLYLGNGPGATGTFRNVPGIEGRGPGEQFDAFHAAAERASHRTLSEREVDAYWVKQTLDSIAENPLAWLRVMLRKLHLYCNGRELSNVYDGGFYRTLNPALWPTAQFVLIAPFALLGTLLWLAADESRRFVAWFNLFVCAAIVLVFVVDRYRLPIVPGALLATTGAVERVGQAFAKRDRRALAWLGAGVLSAVAVAYPIPVHAHWEEEFFKLGIGYHEEGRFDDAERAYLRALDYDAAHVPTLNNLATLYAAQGRVPAAVARFRQLEAIAAKRGDTALLQRAHVQLLRLGAESAGP